MDVTLLHDSIANDGALGRLLRDDTEAQIAVTLEHAYSDGEGGWYSKIPSGHYFCTLGMHPIKGLAYEVMGVPGHTAILFHVGNFNADSDGCILLGEKVSHLEYGVMITNSSKTFHQFMALQDGVPSFGLTVDEAKA